MTIKLGNLKPLQVAVLNIQLIMSLSVIGGNYLLDLPMAFYPDYSKHGAKKGELSYDFNYEVKIQTKGKITNLSLPQHGEVIE